jgi:hypothetical protein
MSAVEVERLIWDLHRRGHVQEFLADSETFLDRYGLTDEEREVLLARDYGGLYRMDLHPMAVLFYSQVNKTPMPAYLEAIGSAPERVEQFKQLMR